MEGKRQNADGKAGNVLVAYLSKDRPMRVSSSLSICLQRPCSCILTPSQIQPLNFLGSHDRPKSALLYNDAVSRCGAHLMA